MKRKKSSGESKPSKRARIGTDSPASNETQPATNKVTVGQDEDAGKSRGKARRNRGNVKVAGDATPVPDSKETALSQVSRSATRREHIRKLAPPRPFPTVPSSVSASGPKTAHKEGKNLICITRHTPLAAYLGRCKRLLVEDGHDVLHLHAMGAAIPHLLTLSVSLPHILPFAKDEIQIEVRTGTIEVMDEVIPDDEDEDISLRVRGKGGLDQDSEKGIIVVQEQEQENQE